MNRDFKGIWIPKEIWLDKNLTWVEKFLIVEIDSLDNDKGCFASNNYFADFFILSPGRISQVINNLIKKEYLLAEYIYEGKEIKNRILKINPLKGIKKIKYPYLENDDRGIKKIKEGYLENDKDNNTIYNNTIYNNKDIIVDDPEIRKLLDYFLINLKGYNPKIKIPLGLKTWYNDLRLMIQNDNLTIEEVKKVIEWLFHSTNQQAIFWVQNIQSVKKLRIHFAKLWKSMNQVNNVFQKPIKDETWNQNTDGRKINNGKI